MLPPARTPGERKKTTKKTIKKTTRKTTKGGIAPPFVHAQYDVSAQVLAGPSTLYFLNQACISFQACSAASLR